MAFQFAPLLMGAGIGALGGLLTGRDPLKGALIGGATGGLLGGLPAGAWGGGGATVAGGSGAGLATGAGTAAGGTGIALGDVAASSALNNTALAGSNLASGVGVGTGIGGASGTGVQLANAGQGMFGFDPVSAAQGGAGISNIGQYATGAGTDIMAATPSMYDQISPYLNVRDLTGAAMVGAQYQQRPQLPTAPAGGIQRGQAPQGTDVMALLQTIKQPERRRISLV
jgi:hypothetical protein